MVSFGCVSSHILQYQRENVKLEGNIDHLCYNESCPLDALRFEGHFFQVPGCSLQRKIPNRNSRRIENIRFRIETDSSEGSKQKEQQNALQEKN